MSLLFSSTPGTNNSLRRKKTKYSLSRQEAVTGWLFVFPILIGFSIFTFWAIIYSFIISLTSWDLLTAPEFVGMRNFISGINILPVEMAIKAKEMGVTTIALTSWVKAYALLQV